LGAFGLNSSKPPGSLKSSNSLQRLSQYFTSDYDNEQGDADYNFANLSEHDIMNNDTGARIDRIKKMTKDSNSIYSSLFKRNLDRSQQNFKQQIPIAISLDIPLEPVEYNMDTIHRDAI
jgi:hypothetical protein